MSGKPEEISSHPAKAPSSSNVSRETSGQRKKQQRSSVYVYLAVLFGAAFLMLLLAYFVQQRNNANVRSDLRITSASRQELLEDIQQLEKEKSQLAQAVDELQRQLEDERASNAQEQQELSHQISSWSDFWELERAYQTGNYERCVEFSRNAAASSCYQTPESAQDRYEEIYQNLEEQGRFGEDAPSKR